MGKIDLNAIGNIVDKMEKSGVLNNGSVKEEGLECHKIEEYDEIKDNFIRYRQMVNDAIKLYEQARQIASVSEIGLSASIYNMAEPFRKGHFTLAIVGKMSAGKSTFINALLEDKDLLPTGYLQTTCTITTITHSNERKLHVCYGDNREEVISDNIGQSLLGLVAIDPKYSSLPINNINRLILGGMSQKEICGEMIVKELENVSRMHIDIALLKEYINEHPKKTIPMEVAIEVPLNENYKGWRIVDTPGVDAIGGIEDDTRRFLCGKDNNGNHNVDAIIFVQPAKGDMMSKTFNDFVNDTIGDLTEEARKRAFIVLTHAAIPEFRTRKAEILELAKQLFVDYAHVGDGDRMFAVDSLCALIENDRDLDFKLLVKATTPAPPHWNSEEWRNCRQLIKDIKGILEDDEDLEFNNENTRRKLHEMANFDEFRNYLNEFVKREKHKSFKNLIDAIEKEINACISIRKQDIRILETNLGKGVDAFLKDLKAEKVKLDEFQKDVNIKFAKLSYKYGKSNVDDKFQKGGLADISPAVFKSLPSLQEMRKLAEKLGNLAGEIAKGIQNNITDDVRAFIEISQQNKGFALPAIDYMDIASRIEMQAEQDSDKIRVEERRQPKTSSGLFIRKRIGDFFGTNWGYHVWNEEVHYNDLELASISFCNNLREEMDKYRTLIIDMLQLQVELIDKDVKAAIKKRKEDYDKMAKNEDLVYQIKQKKAEIEYLMKACSNLKVYHI